MRYERADPRANCGRRGAGRHLLAMLMLVAMVHPTVAQQSGAPAGGNAAPAAGAGAHSGSGSTGGSAAARHGGAPKNDTSARGAEGEARGQHGPHGAPQGGTTTETGTGAHGHRTPAVGNGVQGGAAGAPPVDASIPPAHRITRQSVKDLLPKPPHAINRPNHNQHQPPAENANPVRNAIGIPLGNATIPKPDAPRPPSVPTGTTPKTPSQGVAATTTGGTSIRPLVPVPTIGLDTAHRAGLNGTGMSRVGSGPAVLGGAARTTTGVNGTSFRSKHGN
jgi:hypothetical protein